MLLIAPLGTTWRSLAQTSIWAEFSSGNVPTTRVQRRISLLDLAIPPLTNPHGRALILRHYVQSILHLFDRSSMAKQNLSHRANVICDGSPSRIRMVRRISLGMTTRPRSSIRLTMPVAFIYQIPPVDANVAQIVSACQRPAMQIFPVSCFWKAAPRKNAHAA